MTAVSPPHPGRAGLFLLATRFVALLIASLIAGCGDEEPVPSPPGCWEHAVLDGVNGASGLAVLGDRLLVATSTRRSLLVVDLEDVRHEARVPSRLLPLEVDREARLGGSGSFAAAGYRLGDLWDQPVDFQGLSAQAPDHIFLAERNYRVVYAGRLVPTPDRTWRSAVLERLFVLPGGERTEIRAADWRDKGPGVAGLDAIQGERRAEDLYVVDRAGSHPGTFRIYEMDRFGLMLGWFTADLGAPEDADVGGIVREGARYVVVRGPGRGLLVPVRAGRWRERIRAGSGVPGPDIEGAGPWRGMARLPDGTLYLVSWGDEAVLAWRRP